MQQVPVSPPMRVPHRAVGVGHWRAFAAVARLLNFRAAADELFVTQSAVSRQIQALEDEVGTPLFTRHTRAVELTTAGSALLRVVAPAVDRIDAAVRQVRLSLGRKVVGVTTFASFASMWLIPRLEAFQKAEPDIDIRIDASDLMLDLDTADVDLALRYSPSEPPQARGELLFTDVMTVVASPWLMRERPIRSAADLAQHTLIEADDPRPRMAHLNWSGWLAHHGLTASIKPQRWLYFNFAYQMVQSAAAGQGVVLSRLPMVADALARGELVEPLPQMRMAVPMGYWLVPGPRGLERPETQAFAAWLRGQATATREAMNHLGGT
jgi:LysR family transcriptional regulator, glycine cleavage system transcriptional activator